MTHAKRSFALTTAVLFVGGCGAQSIVMHDEGDDQQSSAATSINTLSETPTPTTAPTETRTDVSTTATAPTNPPTWIPSPANAPPPVNSTAAGLDPFGLPFLSFADSPDLLSLFLDSLMLDLLIPVGGGGFADDFTHLELLCLDGDDPESFCRRRFGP